MVALEQLTLQISVRYRDTFIDGTDVDKIRSRLPRLATFTFSIYTFYLHHANGYGPSTDDVQRTFAPQASVRCFVDYAPDGRSQCHIFSVPFAFDYLEGITNHFPDDRFMNVRELLVCDWAQPFEREFFERIAHSFPLLQSWIVLNKNEPQERAGWETLFPPVEYRHLVHLNIRGSHIAYVEHFLRHTRMNVPRLTNINIDYEKLALATENFTNDATRANCVKIEKVFFERATACSREFYLYFSSL